MNAKKHLSILLWVSGTLSLGTAACEAASAPGGLATPVISEFLASNGSQMPLGPGDLLDADGDSSDWIELHNPTATTFDLGGWYLTDDANRPKKWRFPAPTLLAPDGYLLVFASGKDRTSGQLHTNFKLDAAGGYLGLVMADGITVAYDYGQSYPPQLRDVSYGLPQGRVSFPQYLASPTPGRVNTAEALEVVASPQFSHPHGLYDAPFLLTLACATPGAVIHYTTDGTLPTETGQLVYTAPIPIATTTCVRALASKPGCRARGAQTRTYIFPSDVAQQPSAPRGFPTVWGSTPADYAMDSSVLSSRSRSSLAPALRALPTVSLVLNVDDLFGARGIYTNPTAQGVPWERPASVEWISPDGAPGFQVDAGLRIQGGAFRRFDLSRKKSFRLLFKELYGPTKLNFPLFDDPDAAISFDTLILRAGANDAWDNWGGAATQYIVDEFMRRTQLALGRPSAHGTFVHLYLNGLYWGLYNLTERPDASFCATYLGGEKEEWDALTSGSPLGTSSATSWNAMLSLVRQGVDNNVNYQRLQGNNPDGTRNPAYNPLLDLDNYIDYLFCNFWGGTGDWPWHNFYSACRRPPNSTGFQFFNWDSEGALVIWSNLNANVTNVVDGAAVPYVALRKNPDFCLLFADHVQKHLFYDGPATVAPSQARYRELADQVEPAIVAESARWGDQARALPYTVDDWRKERDYILSTYMPQRPALVLSQLKDAGLYPAVDAPVFLVNGAVQQGGPVPANNQFALTAPAGAAVYYTTDGSDPRIAGFLSADNKIITLVAENAPKRVLVPSLANGGDKLTNLAPGFTVTYYKAKGTVSSLAVAEAVLADTSQQASTAQEQAGVINYFNTGSPGEFGADRPLPGTTMNADVDNYVVLVTGKVLIPQPGNWTFGVSSDDGFGLTLTRGAKTYTMSYPDPRAPGDTLSVFNIAEAGLHDLRLVYYEQGGGSELELFAARGSFAAFSAASFRLVGDVSQGGLQVGEGNVWYTNAFDDSSWRFGTGGVGYERASGYETLFQIDVGPEMYQINGSCYIRIPFTAPDTTYSTLQLRIRYDDGFIAYLNGAEVARRNFTGAAQWNSTASVDNPDTAAVGQTVIDISPYAGLLSPGTNLLAIHGLNGTIDSSDFLISVELAGGEQSQGAVAPGAILYTGPVPLRQSARVKARAFNGKWSALNEAVFAVGPVAQGLRVSELMYHPQDTGNPNDPNTEFIELTNIAGQNLNLNLVRFTQGVHYTFPSFDLAAGGYCLVVKDRAAFQAKYGAGLPVVGQYEGSLDNAGEHVELVDALGQVIQSFTYRDSWYKSTDGRGYSLTVRDPRTTDANGLNDKNAWRASTFAGGSPGQGDPG